MFRVWDKVNRVFHAPESKKFLMRSDGCLLDHRGNGDPGYVAQRRVGYKDIRGVEIYEGDIVRYSADGHTFHEKVAWEHFGWTTQSKTGKFAHPMCSLDYEVIGNIMENSNLLPND